MIDVDIFVEGLRADLNYRLDRMRCIDLAQAISRRGLSEDDVAHIIHRYDMLRVIEDAGDEVAP